MTLLLHFFIKPQRRSQIYYVYQLHGFLQDLYVATFLLDFPRVRACVINVAEVERGKVENAPAAR